MSKILEKYADKNGLRLVENEKDIYLVYVENPCSNLAEVHTKGVIEVMDWFDKIKKGIKTPQNRLNSYCINITKEVRYA